MSNKKTCFHATAEIANYDDILCFAKSLAHIPEFCKLTAEEKMKIIFSYPFRIEIKWNEIR